MERRTRYGFGVTLPVPYETAVERTTAALATEGFGVLTRIDVRATLQEKLGVDIGPYVILGACNPPYARRALEAEREIGLLLPCNVIVYALDDGRSAVSIMDPAAALSLTDNPAIAPLAVEVKAKLERALEALVAACATSAEAGDATSSDTGVSVHVPAV